MPLSASASDINAFICYAHTDVIRVRALHDELMHHGVNAWLDERRLLAGQDWDREIRLALRRSHVVIVCLSNAAVSREGYIQKEIRQALDMADEKPDGTIFLIPVRLDSCEVPDSNEQVAMGGFIPT